MKKEALKKYRLTNGMLAGILVLLFIIIVVLAIALIVKQVNKTGEGNGGETTLQTADGVPAPEVEVEPQESAQDEMTDASEIAAEINNQYASGEQSAEAKEEFQNAIAEARDEEKYWKAVQLLIEQARYMKRFSGCDAALSFLETNNLDGFNDQQLTSYYSDSYGISLDCDDAQAQEKWEALMVETSDNIKGAYGG